MILTLSDVGHICSEVGMHLADGVSDRDRLIDYAVTLLMVAHELKRRVDQCRMMHGETRETKLADAALETSEDILDWVGHYGHLAARRRLHARLTSAQRSCLDAVQLLKRAG